MHCSARVPPGGVAYFLKYFEPTRGVSWLKRSDLYQCRAGASGQTRRKRSGGHSDDGFTVSCRGRNEKGINFELWSAAAYIELLQPGMHSLFSLLSSWNLLRTPSRGVIMLEVHRIEKRRRRWRRRCSTLFLNHFMFRFAPQK